MKKTKAKSPPPPRTQKTSAVLSRQQQPPLYEDVVLVDGLPVAKPDPAAISPFPVALLVPEGQPAHDPQAEESAGPVAPSASQGPARRPGARNLSCTSSSASSAASSLQSTDISCGASSTSSLSTQESSRGERLRVPRVPERKTRRSQADRRSMSEAQPPPAAPHTRVISCSEEHLRQVQAYDALVAEINDFRRKAKEPRSRSALRDRLSGSKKLDASCPAEAFSEAAAKPRSQSLESLRTPPDSAVEQASLLPPPPPPPPPALTVQNTFLLNRAKGPAPGPAAAAAGFGGGGDPAARRSASAAARPLDAAGKQGGAGKPPARTPPTRPGVPAAAAAEKTASRRVGLSKTMARPRDPAAAKAAAPPQPLQRLRAAAEPPGAARPRFVGSPAAAAAATPLTATGLTPQFRRSSTFSSSEPSAVPADADKPPRLTPPPVQPGTPPPPAAKKLPRVASSTGKAAAKPAVVEDRGARALSRTLTPPANGSGGGVFGADAGDRGASGGGVRATRTESGQLVAGGRPAAAKPTSFPVARRIPSTSPPPTAVQRAEEGQPARGSHTLGASRSHDNLRTMQQGICQGGGDSSNTGARRGVSKSPDTAADAGLLKVFRQSSLKNVASSSVSPARAEPRHTPSPQGRAPGAKPGAHTSATSPGGHHSPAGAALPIKRHSSATLADTHKPMNAFLAQTHANRQRAAAAAAAAAAEGPPSCQSDLFLFIDRMADPAYSPPAAAAPAAPAAAAAPKPRDPSLWTVEQVTAYLRGVNLDGQYVDLLEKNRFNGLCLLNITRSELVDELGIDQFSAVKTIITVQAQLRSYQTARRLSG
ncbi:hypothetical protein DIPPA_34396 [Diplonema papillatum]|nr:hypothetical protein DIPPA_34396 [Diplonema papillatum]